MGKSKISWLNDGILRPESWNPITGCTPISLGCANCYARRHADRFYGGDFAVKIHESRFNDPFRWRKPRRVFVCSMSDLFHDDVEQWMLHKIFKTMLDNPEHTFMVLTKRAKWMREYWNAKIAHRDPHNIWLGVTAENAETYLRRVPELAKCKGNPVKFVSAEPLLGPLPMKHWTMEHFHWMIVGGESGVKARPMNPDWISPIRGNCRIDEIPFYFKQWGEWMPATQLALSGDVVYPASWCFGAGHLPDYTTYPFGGGGHPMIRRRHIQADDNPNDNLFGKRYHTFPVPIRTTSGVIVSLCHRKVAE